MKKTPLTLVLLLSLSAFAGDPKPKYVSSTIPLSQDHAYFMNAKTTDYWLIAPYSVPQHNLKACSAASILAVVNAIRPDHHKTSDAKNFLLDDLFKISPALKAAVDEKKGKGQSLDELHKNLGFLTKLDGNATYVVDKYRFNGPDAKVALDGLKKLLAENEANPNNFIIANFLQGALTGDPEGPGHISPIGAYDAEKDRVLVMDVDREYYEPYWVSTETLMKGMNEVDGTAKKARGLVVISRTK